MTQQTDKMRAAYLHWRSNHTRPRDISLTEAAWQARGEYEQAACNLRAGDAQPKHTREELVQKAAKNIVSYTFGECQPDKGDVFGWIDDHAVNIAEDVITALLKAAVIRVKE